MNHLLQTTITAILQRIPRAIALSKQLEPAVRMWQGMTIGH
jgi:hypothetical protein